MPDAAWEQRNAALWATLEHTPEDRFVVAIDTLAGELPDDDPAGPFERAAARDSTGHSDQAVPLYREALALGLTGIRRRRATIQMASSLRNLGHGDEALRLLFAERDQPSDELDDALAGFLALALADAGREREALTIALTALAPHLPRYQRSLANYAADL
jgi:hypothetical protein